MLPPDALSALELGLVAVVEVAALAFIVLVGIAAFRYMRSAVGGDTWVDSRGNEYASEADADEADRRAEGAPSAKEIIQSYDDWEFEFKAKKQEFVDHHAPIDQDAIDRANDEFHYQENNR